MRRCGKLVLGGLLMVAALVAGTHAAVAQTCSGTVQCGVGGDGRYVCSGNQTFECVPTELECETNGWGTCQWIEENCVANSTTLPCNPYTTQAACMDVHNNCADCSTNTCSWDPGGGGGPTPTTPPGVTPEPTLPACAQSNCGTQCPPDGSGTCQGTTTCTYLGGQNGHRCWDDGTCCQAGGSQTQCFDICNENTVSPPTRTCQDTSFTCEVDPICPGGECCLKASCIPSTYTCSNIVWRDGSEVGKWPSVQSRPG